MMNHPIGRLRLIGMLEGISFLILLGIAMPLKYMAGMPMAVKYFGWAHGILFMLYIAAVTEVWLKYKWPLKKTALAFAASLVPFGPFLMDGRLKKEQAAG